MLPTRHLSRPELNGTCISVGITVWVFVEECVSTNIWEYEEGRLKLRLLSLDPEVESIPACLPVPTHYVLYEVLYPEEGCRSCPCYVGFDLLSGTYRQRTDDTVHEADNLKFVCV
jgi:hypothetical protein